MVGIEEIVHNIASYISLILDAIAILIVAVGALGALMGICRTFMEEKTNGQEIRSVFINFARWLIAALTFQLASDIIGTTLAPTWDQLGRLASIALIRTFLTYFLDRDLEKAREEQHARERKYVMPQSGGSKEQSAEAGIP